jgi:hypothetical protein
VYNSQSSDRDHTSRAYIYLHEPLNETGKRTRKFSRLLENGCEKGIARKHFQLNSLILVIKTTLQGEWHQCVHHHIQREWLLGLYYVWNSSTPGHNSKNRLWVEGCKSWDLGFKCLGFFYMLLFEVIHVASKSLSFLIWISEITPYALPTLEDWMLGG